MAAAEPPKPGSAGRRRLAVRPTNYLFSPYAGTRCGYGGERWSVVDILVVDDEPDLRFILRRIFEGAGHRVTEARNGAAALDAVAEAPPDLMVTDMMMPVMGGAELIRRLRAEPGTAEIPIMAVSGDPHLAGGADVIMPKPFQKRELLAAVEDLLNSTEAKSR